MAYAQNFTLNFGAGYEALTLNGRLYDSGGNAIGSLITSDFVNLGHGLYSYLHNSIPDGLRGTFKVWAPSDADLGSIGLALNPEDAEDVADILAYVQNLTAAQASSDSSSGSTIDTVGSSEPTGSYLVEPQGFRMVTPQELGAEVREIITEPALKEAMIARALRASINEEDHKAVVFLTFTQTLDEDDCDYPAPCSGLPVVGVTVRGPTDCADCYTPAAYTTSRNRLRLVGSLTGTGRITVGVPNRYVPDQRTVAFAAETETSGLWAIYIEGQPELPGSAIIRIHGDPWVYAYKAGVTFGNGATINSATGLDSETGTTGAVLPDGVHTVLYAQRIANCGRLPESEVEQRLPGSVVEWPLLYRDGTHREYLLALAQAKCFAYLVNSSRSDRDVNRFQVLQQHWQTEALRLLQKLPKLSVARTRRTSLDDGFRSTFSLRTRRARPVDGRPTRVYRLW